MVPRPNSAWLVRGMRNPVKKNPTVVVNLEFSAFRVLITLR
jgi:hypothetical protein